MGLAGHLPEVAARDLTNVPAPRCSGSAALTATVASSTRWLRKEVPLSQSVREYGRCVASARGLRTTPPVIPSRSRCTAWPAANRIPAEALIAAAENGKEVTALFELARPFDERATSNGRSASKSGGM